MGLFKRVYLSITRNWRKTFILFLIVLIISIVVSLGLGIRNGAIQSAEKIKNNIGFSATRLPK